jgi:hypothetical protein
MILQEQLLEDTTEVRNSVALTFFKQQVRDRVMRPTIGKAYSSYESSLDRDLRFLFRNMYRFTPDIFEDASWKHSYDTKEHKLVLNISFNKIIKTDKEIFGMEEVETLHFECGAIC